MSYVKDQSNPVSNSNTPIWDLVIQDMKERNTDGINKYGTPLQAFNGRQSLVDAYQEALDLTVYLRQKIEEEKSVLEAQQRYDELTDECIEHYHNQIDICEEALTTIAQNGGPLAQTAQDTLDRLRGMNQCSIHKTDYKTCEC